MFCAVKCYERGGLHHTPSGIKIQIVPDTLIEASETGRGHAVYEELRKLNGIYAALDNEGKNVPLDLLTQIRELKSESLAINSQAWNNFLSQ